MMPPERKETGVISLSQAISDYHEDCTDDHPSQGEEQHDDVETTSDNSDTPAKSGITLQSEPEVISEDQEVPDTSEGTTPQGAAPVVLGPHARYQAMLLGEPLPEEVADSSWFDEMIAPLELSVPG